MFGACSCLLALWTATATVEAVGGVDTEVAAGAAPLDFIGPAEPTIAVTLTPLAALQLTSPTQTFNATYTPRIFQREPNSFRLDRPLFLHQGSLFHSWQARRLFWENSLRLSVGEIDYTANAVISQPGRSRPVRTSVADILRMDGQSSIAVRESARTEWGFVASAEYTTALNQTTLLVAGAGASDPMGTNDGLAPVVDGGEGTDTGEELEVTGDPIPTTWMTTGVFFAAHRLTRLHRVSARAISGYQSFADTGDFLLLSPEVSYEYFFPRQGVLSLTGGLVYLRQLSVPPQGIPVDDNVGGTGNVSVSSQLVGSGGVRVTGQLQAGVEWVFDPILQRSQPGALADASFEMQFGRYVRVRPTVTFFTLLNAGSVVTAAQQQMGESDPDDPFADPTDSPDATSLFAQIPVVYRFHPNWSLRAGARMVLRGRPLDSPNFQLGEQEEYWIYAGLTWVLSTKTYAPGNGPDWVSERARDTAPGRN